MSEPTLWQLPHNGLPEKQHDIDLVVEMIRDVGGVPVEPCQSFSPESERHCHNPKGHDGAHEAYMAYGYGVFHTVSWGHTLDEIEDNNA